MLSSLLQHILKERKGERIDTILLQNIIKSFGKDCFSLIIVTLGIDNSDFKKTNLTLYVDSFEKQFLEETERYYKEESQSFISENPVTEYMKKAEIWLEEEDNRVKNYLHRSSQKPLIALVEVTLLTNHAKILQEQFKPLLEREKLEDLSRMYTLLMRVPDNMPVLRDTFEKHVKDEGLAAIRKVVEAISAGAQSGSTTNLEEGRGSTTEKEEKKGSSELDPKVYSDTLLEVYTKFNSICTSTFKAEAGFTASLDKACREFVNRNAFCPDGSSKSSETLAKYCDTLLRKSTKTTEDSEMEILLNGIVLFFSSNDFVDDHFQILGG